MWRWRRYRPLTYISDEISDPEPLTPAHLLHGRRLTSLPHKHASIEELQDPNYGAEQVRRDAKIQAILLEHFTARWKHEYLTSLREFYRPSGKGGQQIQVGDVVLIHNESPRINWKMAVVKSLVTGNDGLVRSAIVKTKNGVTNRPVTKLYPLELADKKNTEVNEKPKTEATQNSKISERPRRHAAQQARRRVAEWMGGIRAPPEDVEDDD